MVWKKERDTNEKSGWRQFFFFFVVGCNVKNSFRRSMFPRLFWQFEGILLSDINYAFDGLRLGESNFSQAVFDCALSTGK